MSETGTFRTVLRGYEPAQVDERVGEPVRDLRASQERAAELARQVEALQRDLAGQRAGTEAPQGASDYAHLGARVGRLLALAEEEAADLLARAAADAAVRREEAEAAEARRSRAAEERIAAVERTAEQARARCEEEAAEASSRARQVLSDAQARADRVVAEAREVAERVRAESERELSAAAQRRDSINAQLSAVRRVLATLSVSAVVPAQAQPAAQERSAAVVDLRPAGEAAGR